MEAPGPGLADRYRQKREYYKDQRVARSYDQLRFHSLAGRLEDCLDKLSLLRAVALLPHQARIAEIACGTGRIAKFLADRGFDVWGVDISTEMLRMAQTRLGTSDRCAPLCCADAEELPFPAGSFDGVVCVRFFTHVPPSVRVRMLAEMGRISSEWVMVQYALSHRVIPYVSAFRPGARATPRALVPSWEAACAEFCTAGLRVRGLFPKLPYLLHSHLIVATTSP